MPVFSIQSKNELDTVLRRQMQRLNTDFIDFYLFHSLTKSLWKKTVELGMIEWAKRQVAKGRLGYLGFSFHDELEVFKEIIDGYNDWTLCQIQYNYLMRVPAGRQGASNGLGWLAMG